MKQVLVIWFLAVICSVFMVACVGKIGGDAGKNVASIYLSLHGGGR